MKISEAMRIGAMMHPQTFGELYVYDDTIMPPVITATCALGAARVGGASAQMMVTLAHRGPRRIYCPLCSRDYQYVETYPSIERVIIHLNDSHYLSREAIADWLEKVELAHEELFAVAPTVKEELVPA